MSDVSFRVEIWTTVRLFTTLDRMATPQTSNDVRWPVATGTGPVYDDPCAPPRVTTSTGSRPDGSRSPAGQPVTPGSPAPQPVTPGSPAPQPVTPGSPAPQPVTPGEALDRLLAGNRRFREGAPARGHHVHAARAHAAAQYPHALVVTCFDSRVIPEALFDADFGDMVVVRTGGHVLDRAALASVDLAVDAVGVPLVLVLGHSACAAVAYAIDGTDTGNGGGYLVEEIGTAVRATPPGPDRPERVMRAHVARTAGTLRRQPGVAAAVAAGRLAVVGARYDLDAGQVDLLH